MLISRQFKRSKNQHFYAVSCIFRSCSDNNEQGVEFIIEKNNETTDSADKIVRASEENSSNAQELNDIIEKFSY